MKCNRYFEGNSGKPDEAEDWLAQIERSFVVFEVPQHLRVEYGTYMLRLRARTWWDSRRRDLPEPITWAVFRQNFLKEYFPTSLRVKYSADFLHLAQRGRSIDQYETEFSRLLQYAPESYRTSEELKVQIFLGGLDDDLRCRLEEFEVTTYQALVEKARVLENARKKKFVPRTNTFGKRPYDNAGFNQRFKKPLFQGFSSSKGKGRQDVRCWKCKGDHLPRQCPQLKGKCFFCGESTHMVTECPKKTTSTCFICKQVGHFAITCPQRQLSANKPLALMGNVPTNKKNGGNVDRPAGRIFNLEGSWEDEDENEEFEMASLEMDGSTLVAGWYFC